MHSKKILLVLVILVLPAFAVLIRPGYFPMHDDIQGMRLLQMANCIADLQIPCRWVPDMGFGFGYPQFNFYAPLPYYSVIPLVLVGGSILESVKVIFVVSVIGAAVGMYLLGSYFWGIRGGIVSALFYVYAPYRALNMYVRGAVGELWGMMFLPFVFYFTLKVLEGSKKSILPLSLSVAGLALSHNITVIMILPFYILFVVFSKKLSLKKIVNLGISGVWGLGLSAFFVLPAFFEKGHVHVETILQGYFNYLAHFISVRQIFLSTFWGYGVSVLGELDTMSFTVGILHWIIPVLSIFLLVYLNRLAKAKLVVLFFILGLMGLFMAHSRSVFLWNNIPVASYIQFPWRFLAIGTFFFSTAAGGIVAALPNKRAKTTLIAILFLVLILFYGSFFKPKNWIDTTDSEKFSGESWQKQQTISIFDYLPIYAKYPPASSAQEKPEILDAEGRFLNGGKGTNWQKWEIEMEGEGKLRLQLFDFPVWEVKVDDEAVVIDNGNDLGLITVSVPKGAHAIDARLRDTNLRRFSNLLTLFSLVAILIYYKKLK
jgi:hypothetical protein